MRESESYRVYIADMLMAMSKGKTLQSSWREYIRVRPSFDAEAVTDSVIKRAGLEVSE